MHAEVRHGLRPAEVLRRVNAAMLRHRGEARGPAGFFGPERLATVVAGLAGRSADALADGVLAAVSDFQRGRLRDDVALLVVQAQR